jgi:hypothetical protein
LTTRNINFGFQGWERPPPFTQYAKDVLCSSSEEFRLRYGEHYVIGQTQGASLKIIILAEASSREEKASVAADLEASYSGWGVEASGGISGGSNTRRGSSTN